MERVKLDFWVGLFVLAGIGALAILALKVGNLVSLDANRGYQVYADFSNVGGLRERAPVKSAGVVVGRVAEIAFDQKNFKAKVTLLMDARYRFPKDTSASILTSGLLGEQYIGLEAGADSEDLKGGDRIALTQSALVLENLIGQFLYEMAGKSSGDGSDK